ncbi:MAG TPA: hypothetical protein VFA18_19660 [Gemmataceae bacterium]|nr:hypothetical protein [Gemmataceae bacterium]
MIQPPRRSITRFFIPLIDVLTLLFCIFLLSPVIKAGAEGKAIPAVDNDQLKQERVRLEQDLQRLRADRRDILQGRLAVQVLQISDESGKLYFYDPAGVSDRWVEVTAQNVQPIIERARAHAGDKAVYFLILYPRPARGETAFPTLLQRRQYDRWFAGVAHGFEVPMAHL